MINHELFNILTKLPHIAGRIQKTARKSPPCYGFLHQGFAYEFYQTDKNKQLVSWFWPAGEFVIPTSPYSNIVFSKDAEFFDFDYSVTFRHLRQIEEDRDSYAFTRAVHNLQIAERISDIRYLSPFKNYLKLKQCIPEVFSYLSEETISSYLNIEVVELRRFMLRRRAYL